VEKNLASSTVKSEMVLDLDIKKPPKYEFFCKHTFRLSLIYPLFSRLSKIS